jgi:predicted transcriptional regulator
MDIDEIREKRRALKASQWRLASLVNRSGPWLGLRESGYVQPSEDELQALEEALLKIECGAVMRAGG